MSKQKEDVRKNSVAKVITVKVIPVKNIVDREQFDNDGNLVCPTCKKSLRGLKTNISDSLIAPEKHTTKRRKVQCCSEECTAKFYIVQQKSFEE